MLMQTEATSAEAYLAMVEDMANYTGTPEQYALAELLGIQITTR